MEPLLVFPAPVPAELVQWLDLAGYPWKAVADGDEAATVAPDDGWAGAVVLLGDQPEAALALCATLRRSDTPLEPLLVLIDADQLELLAGAEDLYDDLCVQPCAPGEMDARMRHLFWRTGGGTRPELVEYGGLVVNLETYQAAVDGAPIDLTYMEYELLKFLLQNPGKVFTREVLLSRVWGYEYYGGARTVDVHVRRLRAKLGEQHAGLIQTVRSVGYRFGQSRWGR